MKDGITIFQVYRSEVELVHNLTQQVQSIQEKMDKVTSEATNYKESCKAIVEVTKQVPFNYGKTFDEVHECKRIRKVASIKQGSEQALSFVKSFGLSVEKVVLRSPTKIVELKYDIPESSAGCSSSSTTAAAGETENVDETLYLLERFGV